MSVYYISSHIYKHTASDLESGCYSRYIDGKTSETKITTLYIEYKHDPVVDAWNYGIACLFNIDLPYIGME